MRRISRFFYNLLFPIGFLLFLPGYLAKMRRRGSYREKFGQRFGVYDKELHSRLAGRQTTWIHAVSVGEVAVALKLAARMKALAPDLFCTLTTTTTTGFALATKRSPDWMEVLYNPIDFWPVTRRAFSVIQPKRVILIEAEVWPNLVAEARKRKVPIALINARLSSRSERRFRKFRFFVAPVFRELDLVCVPENEDMARWSSLGVMEGRIHRTGNIKYDAQTTEIGSRAPEDFLRSLGITDERPVLFGGSTHAGEEALLAEIFLRLRREFPSLFLIIAPRHVERAREIRARFEQLSLRISLQSDLKSNQPDCLLIDTTGELRDWYSVATVVFVGKSLTARGGQNPVEPIIAGKPVIFGPHMENFAALARSLVVQGAAIQIEDADSLQERIAELLRDSAERVRLVANAAKVLAAHRGATAIAASLAAEMKSHE